MAYIEKYIGSEVSRYNINTDHLPAFQYINISHLEKGEATSTKETQAAN